MLRLLTTLTLSLILATLSLSSPAAGSDESHRSFDPQRDLISLHFDHAPDLDDGHSAAADVSVLLALHDSDWIKAHTLAVSGTYGLNKRTFNPRSDAVMDAAFGPLGGWIAAHKDWDLAVNTLVDRWSKTLTAGGDIWVKEGGQSDITAAVVKLIKQRSPDIDTTRRIHVVQHSQWNERQTTPDALTYTKANTHYSRIKDANRYLNVKGGNKAFETAARNHPVLGPAWRAAFDYYNPSKRLDFSDTGELLHILNLGEPDIDTFAQRFLTPGPPQP
jgi:hypothetical protein